MNDSGIIMPAKRKRRSMPCADQVSDEAPQIKIEADFTGPVTRRRQLQLNKPQDKQQALNRPVPAPSVTQTVTDSKSTSIDCPISAKKKLVGYPPSSCSSAMSVGSIINESSLNFYNNSRPQLKNSYARSCSSLPNSEELAESLPESHESRIASPFHSVARKKSPSSLSSMPTGTRADVDLKTIRTEMASKPPSASVLGSSSLSPELFTADVIVVKRSSKKTMTPVVSSLSKGLKISKDNRPTESLRSSLDDINREGTACEKRLSTSHSSSLGLLIKAISLTPPDGQVSEKRKRSVVDCLRLQSEEDFQPDYDDDDDDRPELSHHSLAKFPFKKTIANVQKKRVNSPLMLGPLKPVEICRGDDDVSMDIDCVGSGNASQSISCSEDPEQCPFDNDDQPLSDEEMKSLQKLFGTNDDEKMLSSVSDDNQSNSSLSPQLQSSTLFPNQNEDPVSSHDLSTVLITVPDPQKVLDTPRLDSFEHISPLGVGSEESRDFAEDERIVVVKSHETEAKESTQESINSSNVNASFGLTAARPGSSVSFIKTPSPDKPPTQHVRGGSQVSCLLPENLSVSQSSPEASNKCQRMSPVDSSTKRLIQTEKSNPVELLRSEDSCRPKIRLKRPWKTAAVGSKSVVALTAEVDQKMTGDILNISSSSKAEASNKTMSTSTSSQDIVRSKGLRAPVNVSSIDMSDRKVIRPRDLPLTKRTGESTSKRILLEAVGSSSKDAKTSRKDELVQNVSMPEEILEGDGSPDDLEMCDILKSVNASSTGCQINQETSMFAECKIKQYAFLLRPDEMSDSIVLKQGSLVGSCLEVSQNSVVEAEKDVMVLDDPVQKLLSEIYRQDELNNEERFVHGYEEEEEEMETEDFNEKDTEYDTVPDSAGSDDNLSTNGEKMGPYEELMLGVEDYSNFDEDDIQDDLEEGDEEKEEIEFGEDYEQDGHNIHVTADISTVLHVPIYLDPASSSNLASSDASKLPLRLREQKHALASNLASSDASKPPLRLCEQKHALASNLASSDASKPPLRLLEQKHTSASNLASSDASKPTVGKSETDSRTIGAAESTCVKEINRLLTGHKDRRYWQNTAVTLIKAANKSSFMNDLAESIVMGSNTTNKISIGNCFRKLVNELVSSVRGFRGKKTTKTQIIGLAGVAIMLKCSTHMKWPDAFDVLMELLNRKIDFHVSLNIETSSVEIIKNTFQICVHMKRYDVIKCFVEQSNFFRGRPISTPTQTPDQQQVVQRYCFLNVVLLSIAAELKSDESRVILCELGISVLAEILKDWKKDMVAHCKITEMIELSALFELLLQGCILHSFIDGLLLLTEIQASFSESLEWMTSTLRQVLSFFLNKGQIRLILTNIFQLVVEHRILPKLPEYTSDESNVLVVWSNMSCSEMSLFIFGYLKSIVLKLKDSCEEDIICWSIQLIDRKSIHEIVKNEMDGVEKLRRVFTKKDLDSFEWTNEQSPKVFKIKPCSLSKIRDVLSRSSIELPSTRPDPTLNPPSNLLLGGIECNQGNELNKLPVAVKSVTTHAEKNVHLKTEPSTRVNFVSPRNASVGQLSSSVHQNEPTNAVSNSLRAVRPRPLLPLPMPVFKYKNDLSRTFLHNEKNIRQPSLDRPEPSEINNGKSSLLFQGKHCESNSLVVSVKTVDQKEFRDSNASQRRKEFPVFGEQISPFSASVWKAPEPGKTHRRVLLDTPIKCDSNPSPIGNMSFRPRSSETEFHQKVLSHPSVDTSHRSRFNQRPFVTSKVVVENWTPPPLHLPPPPLHLPPPTITQPRTPAWKESKSYQADRRISLDTNLSGFLPNDLTVLPMTHQTPPVNESQEKLSEISKELYCTRIKHGILTRLTFHVKENNLMPKMAKQLESTIYDQFYKEQMHRQKDNDEFSYEVFLELQDHVDVIVNKHTDGKK